MKHLVGYDLNGWRDLAAVRNRGQSPEKDDKTDTVISGGIGGCVVLLNEDGKQRKQRYVGGAQAALAPHGMGRGWGMVGEQERARVRDLIASPIHAEDRIGASLMGLARSADVGVLVIADTGTVTEEAQEALLEAMRRAGVRRRLLVWRPVLALLGAMTTRNFKEHERIGIVTHETPGFGTQVLTLRQGKILAPERRLAGRIHRSTLGLGPLYDSVLDQWSEVEAEGRSNEYLKVSSMPVQVVLGERVETDVLLRSSGSWVEVEPPALPTFGDTGAFKEMARALSDCGRVFFETPVRGLLAERVVDELSHRLDVEVCALPPGTVATGARVAAGRLDDGEPVFFDFLPQISTVVSGEEGARNFNLIAGDDLLPAGEIYRSREPAEFVILADQRLISVFIRKETVPEPRLANVPLEKPVTETTQVNLRVEQQPVSGRARLTLSSSAFVTSQVVDFDAAEPQDQSWEEIIENQERPRPTIPDRMVLPNGLDVWEGIANRQGLSEILAESETSDDPDWKLLARTMASKTEGRYALSSDGKPPESLDARHIAALDRMLSRAENEVRRRIASADNPDNGPLNFATWAYRKCPQSVVAPMLEALDASVKDHPLLLSGGSRTLIYQGLGRTVQDDTDMRRVMDHLFKLPIDRWNKNHVACIGFLLSRTDKAVRQLRRDEVDELAGVVAERLMDETGGDYGPTFIYLPILLVGLLRWRMVEPYALVLKRDPMADLMGEALNRVIFDLETKRINITRLRKHYDILCKSREELAGEGGHSNLLVEIYNLK